MKWGRAVFNPVPHFRRRNATAEIQFAKGSIDQYQNPFDPPHHSVIFETWGLES